MQGHGGDPGWLPRGHLRVRSRTRAWSWMSRAFCASVLPGGAGPGRPRRSCVGAAGPRRGSAQPFAVGARWQRGDSGCSEPLFRCETRHRVPAPARGSLCRSRCRRCSSHPALGWAAADRGDRQSQQEGPAQPPWAGGGVTRVSPHGEVPENPSFLSGFSSLAEPLARVTGVMESVMGQFKFSLLSASLRMESLSHTKRQARGKFPSHL